MTGLVFAMGVLLVLAGAFSVVSGAPIVQLERGWTEVIAGAVAVSGGVVTFALGVVVLRLQKINEAVRVGPRPAAVSDTPDFESAPLRRTRSPDETVYVAGEQAVEGAAVPQADPEFALDRSGLWEGSGSSGAPKPVEDSAAAIVPIAAAAASAEPDARSISEHGPEVSSTSVEPVVADTTSEVEARPRRLLAPSSDLSTAEKIESPGTSTIYARDWLTQPLLRSRSPKALPPQPPPIFASPPEVEEGEAPLVPIVQPNAEEPSLAPSIEGPSVPSEPPTDADSREVTVIGRYQAGASSYTMYSDGAIDVETEGGEVHRFDSMDELKAFIARQETALS